MRSWLLRSNVEHKLSHFEKFCDEIVLYLVRDHPKALRMKLFSLYLMNTFFSIRDGIRNVLGSYWDDRPAARLRSADSAVFLGESELVRNGSNTNSLTLRNFA